MEEIISIYRDLLSSGSEENIYISCTKVSDNNVTTKDIRCGNVDEIVRKLSDDYNCDYSIIDKISQLQTNGKLYVSSHNQSVITTHNPLENYTIVRNDINPHLKEIKNTEILLKICGMITSDLTCNSDKSITYDFCCVVNNEDHVQVLTFLIISIVEKKSFLWFKWSKVKTQFKGDYLKLHLVK